MGYKYTFVYIDLVSQKIYTHKIEPLVWNILGCWEEEITGLKLLPIEMYMTERSICLVLSHWKFKYNFLNAAKYGHSTWFCILQPKGSENSG